jgi:WD40 repeat protein
MSDGSLLSWRDSYDIGVWSKLSGKCEELLIGHQDKIIGVVSLGGKRFLSWAKDQSLRIWDLNIFFHHCELEINHYGIDIKLANIFNDGKIISLSTNGNLGIWNPQLSQYDVMFGECFELIEKIIILDDFRFLTLDLNHKMNVWNIHSETCEIEIDNINYEFVPQITYDKKIRYMTLDENIQVLSYETCEQINYEICSIEDNSFPNQWNFAAIQRYYLKRYGCWDIEKYTDGQIVFKNKNTLAKIVWDGGNISNNKFISLSDKGIVGIQQEMDLGSLILSFIELYKGSKRLELNSIF